MTNSGFVLEIIKIVCARILHDISGPFSGVKAGLDMLNKENNAEVLSLTCHAADQLSQRLAFFRATFGIVGEQRDTRTLSDAVRLVQDWLRGSKLLVTFDASGTVNRKCELSKDVENKCAQLLPFLTMIAAAALPRGGNIRIEFAQTECWQSAKLLVIAEGRGALLVEQGRAALTGDSNAATTDTAPALIAGIVGHQLGVRLSMAAPRLDVVEIIAEAGSCAQ